MLIFLLICLVSGVLFVASLLFDDIDIGDAMNFGDDGGASWLSLRALLLFATGFGATGTIATSFAIDPFYAALIGVAGGTAGAGAGIKLSQLMQRQESDSTPTMAALVGRSAVVTLAVTGPGSIGQVETRNEYGHAAYLSARADEACGEGARVTIVGVNGNTVQIEKVTR